MELHFLIVFYIFSYLKIKAKGQLFKDVLIQVTGEERYNRECDITRD